MTPTTREVSARLAHLPSEDLIFLAHAIAREAKRRRAQHSIEREPYIWIDRFVIAGLAAGMLLTVGVTGRFAYDAGRVFGWW